MTETRADAIAAVVRITRRLGAPPARVFAAWLDSARLAQWLSPVGHAEAEVDPRVGGAFRVTMVGEGSRIEHTGEFLAIEPPRRLRFTWSSPYTGPEASIVTVDLAPIDGGTELTLVHERLPADQVQRHGGGWTRILDRLAALLEHGATTEEV